MKKPNSQEMEEFEQCFGEIAEKMNWLKKRLREEETSGSNGDNESVTKTAVESLASTQFLNNSLFYTSSKEDQPAVNLITKNFDEFSNICSENGLNLVIQREADNGVTIRLIQSSATFSSRKAFKELDDLVKRKSERDEEMEVRFQRLIDNVTEKFESKLSKQEEESSKNVETHKNLIDQQAELIQQMTKKISNLESIVSSQEAFPTKLPIDRFLEERNVKTIRETPLLLEKVCKTLSEELKNGVNPPLKDIGTMEEKKKILREYLDFLQIKAQSTDIQLKISDFVLENRLSFELKSTEEENIKVSTEMKENFQLDNVVGTIHLFSFHYRTKDYVMYLVIVYKKIVAWIFDNVNDDVIYERLHKDLISRYPNYKFATPFKVEEKYSDVFVEVQNKDVFFENEKVITWINNNFDCLKDGINTGKDHFVFPALYNMSLEHVLNPQSSVVPGTNGPI